MLPGCVHVQMITEFQQSLALWSWKSYLTYHNQSPHPNSYTIVTEFHVVQVGVFWTSTWEVEAEGMQAQGQPKLHSEFKTI